MGRADSIRRHWKGWLVGLVAAVLVVVVGGPFVFFHFIEGNSPAPLSLATAPTPTTVGPAGTATTATSGSAASLDGSWKVTAGSQAGYRIQETLFGQSHTAVGRTTALTGSITIDGVAVSAGSFSADLTQVTSDQAQRDFQFQNRIMDTAQFPTATFSLSQPIRLGSLPGDGQQVTESATGSLMLHGTTHTVTFPVQARRSGATIQVSGSIPIVFADYNISNPSGGPATTSDHGTLEFLLDFVHA
jgi:polyisoprenoid-binding protein YceI